MYEHSLGLVDGRQDSGVLVEAVIQCLHPYFVKLFLLLFFVVLDCRQFLFCLFQSLVGFLELRNESVG